jgi:hypothetical protein
MTIFALHSFLFEGESAQYNLHQPPPISPIQYTETRSSFQITINMWSGISQGNIKYKLIGPTSSYEIVAMWRSGFAIAHNNRITTLLKPKILSKNRGKNDRKSRIECFILINR